MAAFALSSSGSNLTLRQIRTLYLRVGKKMRCNFLSCLSFYSFDNLQTSVAHKLTCSSEHTHIRNIAPVIMFPVTLSVKLLSVLFTSLTF